MWIFSILLLPITAMAQGWGEENQEAAFSEPSTEPVVPPEPPPADQDATYIIKKGDTLWDLAFQFLGDPFQWQRIWQLNSYISNPDLIYPGNQLQIPGRSAQFASRNNQGFTSETSGALGTASALKDSLTASTGYPGDSLLLVSFRRKDVVSAGLLRAMPFLWTEKDKAGNIYPGNAEVNAPSTGAAYQRFGIISIKPFNNAVYQGGDTVDIYTSLRFVRFNGQPANLVKRSGRACIQKVTKKEILALLFEMSDAISGKERVAPATSISGSTVDTLVEPDAAITAGVFTRVEETESPYPFQKIILDKGSTQGVVLGDVFGIYHRKDKNSPARLNAIGTIGHVGSASSTLTILIMSENSISDGDQALLLRRARFR